MITNGRVNEEAKDDQNDIHSRENREHLAEGAIKLFDFWQIPLDDQATLLGLSPKNRTTLARYRNGAPLANRTDLLKRVGHLLGIYVTLHQLFPHNPKQANEWVTRPCKKFDGRTPLELMKASYEGLLAVHSYLMFELSR